MKAIRFVFMMLLCLAPLLVGSLNYGKGEVSDEIPPSSPTNPAKTTSDNDNTPTLAWEAATDNAPPVITGVDSTDVSVSGVAITWNTNEDSTSQVEYGLTTGYGSTSTLDTAFVTAHSVALTGLVAGTIYHYRVKSKDNGNNEAVSGGFSFTTAVPPDKTPPVISGVGSSNFTTSGATICWTTNEPATSQVEYGLTAD
jgi:phosphodiesterase/alkaline phosphatase D-like protein